MEDSGQNAIMVVPGANGRVTVADIENARSAILSSSVVLLQLEIPLDAVIASIKIARAAGVRVIVDPAPAPDEWVGQLFDVVDVGKGLEVFESDVFQLVGCLFAEC